MSALVLLLIACQTPTPAEAPAPPQEDRGELLTDVQHLLGEAAAMHAAGRLPDAMADWEQAHGLWTRHLAGPLRSSDALRTLSLEYELGRLRVELLSARGRPKAVAARADRLLEQRRAELTAPPHPAEASGTPASPQ